jgi:parallel beta-helix repeat protein
MNIRPFPLGMALLLLIGTLGHMGPQSSSVKAWGGRLQVLQGSERNITIVAEEQLLGKIQDELATFENDLENEGYQISVIAVTNQTPPYEIKGILRTQYSLNNITGAILMGSIKAAYSENHGYLASDTIEISLDPIDHYFMDLDGHWENVTHPDFFAYMPQNLTAILAPTCTTFYDEYIVYPNETLKWNYAAIENPRQYSAEIWISRIMGHNLDIEGKNESQIVKDFLDWDHDYRTGKRELIANQAYFLSAFERADTLDFNGLFSPIIPQSSADRNLYETCLSDPKGSELLYFRGHSNSKVQALSDGILMANELVQMKKRSVLYILDTCQACRWDNFVWSPNDPNYPGGVYVFGKDGLKDDFGLCAIGLTSSEYGLYGFDLFVKHLNQESRATYGDAYSFWLKNVYESSPGTFELLFSVFLGDPTVDPPHFSVCNVNTGLKYASIQSAIDSPYTNDGHTIRIDGIFCEGFIVHKSLTLEGSGNATAIIDGYNALGPLVQVYDDKVRITGFTIRNAEYGLRLTSCSNCSISKTILTNCGYGLYIDQSLDVEAIMMIASACYVGIYSYFSNNCLIEGGTLVNNTLAGVYIQGSSNCSVSGNNFAHNIGTYNSAGLLIKNSYGCKVLRNSISNNSKGTSILYSPNCTFAENTVNDSAAYGVEISSSDKTLLIHNSIGDCPIAAYLDNSSDCLILGNRMYFGEIGIVMRMVDSCEIDQNLLDNFMKGIDIDYAPLGKDRITNNLVENCKLAMFLGRSNETTIVHNCFINSSLPTIFESVGNIWDNGCEGNYWSDYVGTDADYDGIGDTAYEIDANNTDHYPLMGMFHTYSTSLGHNVNIISNSTIEHFEYIESNGTIVVHVSNITGNQTHGFCRICIPHDLMFEPFNVTINGVNPTYWNYTLYDNGTHRWIYFEYEHSELEIVIVTEFPSSLFILPLLMMVILLAVTIYSRKNKPRKILFSTV